MTESQFFLLWFVSSLKADPNSILTPTPDKNFLLLSQIASSLESSSFLVLELGFGSYNLSAYIKKKLVSLEENWPKSKKLVPSIPFMVLMWWLIIKKTKRMNLFIFIFIISSLVPKWKFWNLGLALYHPTTATTVEREKILYYIALLFRNKMFTLDKTV